MNPTFNRVLLSFNPIDPFSDMHLVELILRTNPHAQLINPHKYSDIPIRQTSDRMYLHVMFHNMTTALTPRVDS